LEAPTFKLRVTSGTDFSKSRGARAQCREI
jgi:hypothetical protein